MNTTPPDDRDYYAILGVPSNASPAEIKRAFRALVKRHHPDLYAFNPNVVWEAEMMMSEINGAYHVLSDPARRQRYDLMLRQQSAGYAPGANARGYATKAQDDPVNGWSSPLFGTNAQQHWLVTLLQWLSVQRTTHGNRQAMGVLSKMLLVPIPFCIATIFAALFWHLGDTTGASFLGRLTAVLAYPLILFPLLLRLWFPIHYHPLLSMKQKLAGMPIILITSMLLGWLWFGVVDHHGTATSQLDLYWWCSLIIATCASLAYF